MPDLKGSTLSTHPWMFDPKRPTPIAQAWMLDPVGLPAWQPSHHASSVGG